MTTNDDKLFDEKLRKLFTADAPLPPEVDERIEATLEDLEEHPARGLQQGRRTVSRRRPLLATLSAVAACLVLILCTQLLVSGNHAGTNSSAISPAAVIEYESLIAQQLSSLEEAADVAANSEHMSDVATPQEPQRAKALEDAIAGYRSRLAACSSAEELKALYEELLEDTGDATGK